MIKDSRYIIRRILIGVGIVLVLGFFNGCKVKAYESVNMTFLETRYDSVSTNSENILLQTVGTKKIYYNPNTKYFYNCFYQNQTNCIAFKPSDYFTFDTFGFQIHNSTALVVQYYFTNNGGTLPTFDNTSRITPNFKSNTLQVSIGQYEQTACTGSNNETGIYFTGYRTYYNYYSTIAWSPYGTSSSTIIDNPLISPAPEFVSFNAIPITSNNVITGYTVQPEFTNFDTDNYIYQYSFDRNRWLSLNTNEQVLRINNNSTIYIRIKDLANNDIIDSATFTITNIGTFYNEQSYDIKFSGNYRTENYLNNNTSSKSQSTIVEYQIYTDYYPKSSILKYQYQYVISGNSLDSNAWQNVSSSDNGSFTYVATENGTLYARILNSDDNVLKTATFTVNSIGLLAFDNNEIGTSNFFDKLRNKIDYGGPVSSLFILPVNFFSNLYNSMSNSNTCSNIQLGSLLGTNLSLPCVDIPRYFGTNVYNIIDFIFSFILLVGIFRFIIKKYNKFISMQDIGDDL